MDEDDEVDALLAVFTSKLADQYDVLEADPRRGVVVVRDSTTVHRLHVDR